MLVGFIGIPSSGKTTQAAEAFVKLKKSGIVTEFVTEVARQYIAAKRQAIGPGATLVLTDEDQGSIFKRQKDLEALMNDPQTITISDSSPLNSLMYMTEAARSSVMAEATAALEAYDLLIVCQDPRPRDFVDGDPNRIHTNEHRQGLAEQREALVAWIKTIRPDLPLLGGGYEIADQVAFTAVDLFYEASKA